MVQSIESAPSRVSGTGRIPPHNIEAEESLLGSMLLSRDAIVDAIEVKVAASDFYKPAYGHIFDAVVDLYGQGEQVDPVTLAEELRRKNLLDAMGGKATLLQLQAATPSSANAGQYASIVAELALLRRLIAVAGEISEEAYSAPEDVGQTLDHAEALVFEVADRRVADSEVKIGDSLALTLDQLEQLYGREDTLTGVPTGYTDLDNLLLGLQPSNLIVVAARPGMGKCVAWDTPIVDPATGAMRTAAELYRLGTLGAPVDVLSLGDDWKLHRTPASAFVDDGIRPVHRVRLRSGREVRTTLAHPFLTARGWRPLAEVAKGDRIAVPREVAVFGRDAMAESEVVLLACLVGGGNVTSSPARVSTRSPEVLTEITAHAATLGVEVLAAGGDGHCFAAPSDGPDPVVDLLRRHDAWGKSAHDKTMPGAIYRLPRVQLANFLSRLFADGGSTSIDRYGNGGFTYRSASESLSRSVQHLLLRFGVIACLRRSEGQERPRATRTYEIQITHSESLRRFCNEIGIFGGEIAVARLHDLVSQQTANPDHDTIPAELWSGVLAERGAHAPSSVAGSTGRPHDNDRSPGSPSPSRETIAVLADQLGSEELRHLAESDVWWDEIIEIEFDGNEQVYDLTVPVGHNFVAADVLVHNTAFALGAAANVAVVEQRPVLFFSMEMGHLELTKRLLAAEARVDLRKLQTGNIPDNEWSMISHAVGRLAAAPLFIDDNPHCTIMEMRAKARRTRAREGDLGLIVIDYLQLMSSPHRVESRQVEVSDFSRGLKILARELDTPVMALSQLNRQLEYRADKRPMLADLRETGSIEQDADVVMFVYRDEVYNPESEHQGMAEIIVAKHRNGPSGNERLAFFGARTKFENMARE